MPVDQIIKFGINYSYTIPPYIDPENCPSTSLSLITSPSFIILSGNTFNFSPTSYS